MFNRSIILGNLTRDVEIKYTASGTAIGSTGIASTKKFKAADGSDKEEVLFIDLSLFGRSAEIANQYLHKGSKVLVEGRIKLDQWTKEDGQKMSRHSIIVESLKMLDSKNDSQQQHEEQKQDEYQPHREEQPQQPPFPTMDDGNENIPF